MGIGATLLGIVVFLAALVTVLAAQKIRREDPTLWRRYVERFAIDDAHVPVQDGGIVFVGSSTIRRWQSLVEDMRPLAVLNRGFGGARIHDLIYYAPQIAILYRPRVIVVYAGENDIAGGFGAKPIAAQTVRDRFEKLCTTIFASLPKTHLYFVSIKPPKRRMASWPEMQEANRMIRAYCDSDERLHFIDITAAMQDGNQRVREDLFVWDGIHLNRQGYEVLTSVIKPHLLATVHG